MSAHLRLALLVVAWASPWACAQIVNGDFEASGFEGWTADPNWVVVDHSCGYYSAWEGQYWAWSGGIGEPATGNLTSLPFVLDRDAVHIRIAGWASIRGTGQPRRWNHVTLNLADGTEIDRVYAPDSTTFVTAWLDGSGYRGESVFVQAVDDADQATFSMLCIDDVRTADLPAEYATPAPAPPPFDPGASVRLENDACIVEVNRANGSITRVADKAAGLELIQEPRLAGSFRFSLPIAGREPWQTLEANWIIGRDQKLSRIEAAEDRVTLWWDGPLRNYLGESFDVSVCVVLELSGEGVCFELRIENDSDCLVGETYFPVLGGLQGLGETVGMLKATQMLRPTQVSGEAASVEPVRSATAAPVFRVFHNMSPFGDQGPEQFYGYPDAQPAPWVGLTQPRTNRSALLMARDPDDRPLWLRLELLPASSGTLRDDGNWPRADELRGTPVGVELSFVAEPELAPGHDYHSARFVLLFLDGVADEMWAAYDRLRAP